MRQRFAALLPAAAFAEFDESMCRAGELMGGRTLWHINATLTGGGVAELMNALVPYMQEAGIDCRWTAIESEPAFLDVTKRLHNWLHGFPGDSGPLGQAQRALYDRVIAENAAKLLDEIRPGDVVFVHDPQPAGLVPVLKNHGVHVIWHCHIGTDEPNDFTRQAWRFLLDTVSPADAYIFSRAQYLWEGLDSGKLHVIRPAIDPFTPKNQELTPTEAGDLLRAHWSIPDGVPVILQTGRWDRLKGHADVIQLFAAHIARDHPDVHLLVAGPSADGVADDPEGAEVYAECVALHSDLVPETRTRVHLLRTPMDDMRQTDLIVNALQRRADVVLQMSQAEGFGLVVAEAMWKRRPVVASRVGGIQDQIEPGRSGILIPDPTDGRAFAHAAAGLLRDRERASRLGERAHERVKEHFLSSRLLTELMRLLTSCLDGGRSIAR
ncbi:glycosyltransferase [Allorhizocola rhizosphaerae]|uniref:glycosyltransferase n=1 Tax=Allorhizocola rhizosphaerae TaxID=1872709 RepID=UPI000E3D456A|nr:glycosyltransferase [Allorhizocola rhizosphaerae]